MSQVVYSYSILRYTHDVLSEESLNVGIVVVAPSIGYVKARIQPEYSRLSDAFDGFNGHYYRKVARHVESHINNLAGKWVSELAFDHRPADAKMVANTVLPDDDSSLRFSEARSGLTANPDDTLDDLFGRFVLRGQPRPAEEGRPPEEVWKTFRAPLQTHNVLPKLHHVTIAGSSFEYEFNHAYKNERWHPLEPISMDAVHADTLRERANRWVGKATDLRDDDSLGTLYLLVGPPQREILRPSYEKAVDLLHKMPISHEIIREDEAEEFAAHFGSLIASHENDSGTGDRD